MQDEESFDFQNSRLDSLRNFFKTFFWLSGEEWKELDHKLIRIGFSIAGFAAMTLFWVYFLRNIIPF